LSIYEIPLSRVWVVSAGMMLVFDWITIGFQYNALKNALKRRNAWDGFFWVLVEGSVQLPLILILLPVLTAQAFALYATMLIVTIFQAAALLMFLVLDTKQNAD